MEGPSSDYSCSMHIQEECQVSSLRVLARLDIGAQVLEVRHPARSVQICTKPPSVVFLFFRPKRCLVLGVSIDHPCKPPGSEEDIFHSFLFSFLFSSPVCCWGYSLRKQEAGRSLWPRRYSVSGRCPPVVLFLSST